MAKMDERAQIISNSILIQAEQEGKLIIAQANKAKKKELSAYEEEIIRTMFETVQKKSNKIRQEAVQEIAAAQVKAQNSLLRRREELTTTVFATVKTRLFEYAGTDAYRNSLLSTLRENKGEWDHSASTISLREADLSLAPRIEQELPGCRVVADRNIKIGGWKLYNQKASILIDQTLDAKLEEQRPWFLSRCAMKITD